jgi:putative addiction module component (TIGR02574 family)
MNLEECRAVVLNLPLADRAILANDLLASLETLKEEEIEALWVQEAEARYEAYKQGKIGSLSMEEAMRKAYERLG